MRSTLRTHSPNGSRFSFKTDDNLSFLKFPPSQAPQATMEAHKRLFWGFKDNFQTDKVDHFYQQRSDY